MLQEEIKAIGSTRRDLRNFGLVVGTVFFAIGALFLWRERGLWPFFGGTGLLLILLGLAAPPLLKPIQKAWMILAVIVGWFMTRLILSLLFYILLTPIALAARLAGKKFLSSQTDGRESYWIRRPEAGNEDGRLEKQF